MSITLWVNSVVSSTWYDFNKPGSLRQYNLSILIDPLKMDKAAKVIYVAGY